VLVFFTKEQQQQCMDGLRTTVYWELLPVKLQKKQYCCIQNLTFNVAKFQDKIHREY